MTGITTKPNRLIPYLLAAVAVFLLFPYTFYETPMKGFDPSWMIALHLAVKYHSIFGPDFSFTYGPLAVLRFRYPIVLSKFSYLLADLYFLFIAFTVFSNFCRRFFRPGPLLFMFCILLLCMDMELEKWYFFFLFYFLISYLAEPRRNVYLVHAGIISAICLYIKVNSGVVDSFFFVATIGYALLAGKMSRRIFACFLLGYIVLLVVSARLLNTELIPYVKNSIYLIKDYNDVMFLPLDKDFGPRAAWLAALTFLTFIVCCLVVITKWLSRKKFFQDLDTLFIYGIIAAALFIWYKNGFVRADGHIVHFYEMTGALVLFLYLGTPAHLGKRITDAGSWLMLAICCVMIISLPRTLIANQFARFVQFSIWPHKFAQIKNYFTTLSDYDRVFAEYADQTARPNEFRSVVGDHTVDVVPTEISICYYDGLRYEPRPGLQSYSVYDSYLDSLGYTKYLSRRAPEYVLYTHDAIDERFPWTDEARLKLAMINRYRPVAMVDSQLILQKREAPRDITIARETVKHVKLGDDIPVGQGDGWLFTRFMVHYNLKGRIQSLFYHPPPLKMVITTEDNQVFFYRAFVPVLADGIILNKFVGSTREFQLLLLSDGRLTPNVKTFKIMADTEGGFAPDIEMINTWYTFGSKAKQEALADSLAIDSLAGGNSPLTPLTRAPSDSDQENTRFGIETFADHGGYIRVSGWALRTNDDNRHNTVRVLLVRTDPTAYEMTTSGTAIKEFPFDLRQRTDLDSTGFKAMIARSRLPPGNYRLTVAISNKETGKSWARDIGEYVDVPHPYQLQRTPRFAANSTGSGDLQYNVESVGIEDGKAFIRGWAILKTSDSQTPTRIILQNDSVTYTVNTDWARRADILAAYKKRAFEYSGFSVVLPLTAELEGKFTIGVEKEDKKANRKEWALSDHFLIKPESNIPVRMDSLPPKGQFYGNIENFEQDGRLLTISGWALNDTLAKAKLISVVLRNTGGAYSCNAQPMSRPDIVGRFRNPALLDCGFSAAIPTASIPAGRYQIGLRIYEKGTPGTTNFFDRFIETK